MKKVLVDSSVWIAFLLALSVIPSFAQELYFGFRTGQNGNIIYQKNPDPISIIYIREDKSFFIFHFWYEDVYTQPFNLYHYNTQEAFTPQIRTEIISKGKMEAYNNKILLHDTNWDYAHILSLNIDNTLTYKKGLIYYDGWEYTNFKKLFKDCTNEKSYNIILGQYENCILLDSTLALDFHDDHIQINKLKVYHQQSKKDTFFLGNELFEDSLSNIRFEFQDNSYKIIFMTHNKLLSVGKISKSLDYFFLDDEEAGQDFIIKFISDSEFELLNCHPLLKGLQILIPLDNHKLGFKPWTFKKINNMKK